MELESLLGYWDGGEGWGGQERARETHDDRDEPAVDEVARDGPEGAPAAQGLVLGLVHAVVVQAYLPHDDDDLPVVRESPVR